MTMDAFCRGLLEVIRQRALRGQHARLDGEPLPAFASLYDALDEEPAMQRLTAEQSNSSVLIGSQLILKLFRRIEAGPHPEIEAGRHLASVGYRGAAQLAGAITWSAEGEPSAAYAVLHEFVWNQSDGWAHARGEAVRYFEEAAEEIEPPGTGEPGSLPEPQYAEAARKLGGRTAELHIALAAAGRDTEFTPEPFTVADHQALLARIVRRLQDLTPALEQMRVDQSDAASIIGAIRELESRLERATSAVHGLVKIRCHGDYHLGQVLWAKEDFTIVDFEGEVGLPLSERRQKSMVLTDLAGMIRSFQYAVAVGLQEHLGRVTDPDDARLRLQPLASYWEQRSTTAFLDGYTQALSKGGTHLLPPADTLRGLLDVHLLDKALHELEYELRHRPEWVSIPLAGVAALLARLE
jgi:maltose alpha-D-glucosyltransferase/alpha-amylase